MPSHLLSPDPSSAAGATPPGDLPDYDEATEVALVGDALQILLRDATAVADLEQAVANGNARAFASILQNHQLLDRLPVLCRWVCSWYVQRRCLWLCRDVDLVPFGYEDARAATLGFAKLAATEGALEKLVEALDRDDEDEFHAVLREFDLLQHCRYVCVLVLTVRCELFCLRLTLSDNERPRELVPTLRDLAAASAGLADEEKTFVTVLRAYQAGDFDTLHRLLDDLQLVRFCHLVCWWLCVLVPLLRCTRICLEIGEIDRERIPQPGDPGPVLEWAKVTAGIAADPDRLHLLLDPVLDLDDKRFVAAVTELGLQPWCHTLCWWFLRLRCYRYCWRICPPRPPLPVFYRLGAYNFLTQVDAGPAGSGLTDDGRAFYATVRLNGSPLQKSYNGGQPEYRFEVRDASGWHEVLAGQIRPTAIGSWTRAGVLVPKTYVVNGTGGPEEITVPVAADGWIQVPTADDYWGAAGYFGPTGDFLRLDTTTVVSPAVHDAASVDGGEPVPGSQVGSDTVVGIRMRWRKVGDVGDGIVVGEATNVAVCNDRWDHVAKFGTWVPTRVDGQLAVVSVDVQELVGGCDEITDQLHVEYTACHPNLGPVSLTLNGPGGFSLTMADDGSATPVNRFGVAQVTAPKTAADLYRCTYTATLSADLLLTTGDSNPDPVWDQIAFHTA